MLRSIGEKARRFLEPGVTKRSGFRTGPNSNTGVYNVPIGFNGVYRRQAPPPTPGTTPLSSACPRAPEVAFASLSAHLAAGASIAGPDTDLSAPLTL